VALTEIKLQFECFENFCDLKFTGTKPFRRDGGESMIPALEPIINLGTMFSEVVPAEESARTVSIVVSIDYPKVTPPNTTA
jgi:hypothetical protein